MAIVKHAVEETYQSAVLVHCFERCRSLGHLKHHPSGGRLRTNCRTLFRPLAQRVLGVGDKNTLTTLCKSAACNRCCLEATEAFNLVICHVLIMYSDAWLLWHCAALQGSFIIER